LCKPDQKTALPRDHFRETHRLVGRKRQPIAFLKRVEDVLLAQSIRVLACLHGLAQLHNHVSNVRSHLVELVDQLALRLLVGVQQGDQAV
jgi:hypothetical protein